MEMLNRRHPGITYKLSFIFAFIAVFTFLNLKLPQDSQAASLANFNPGNIISDYTMSNYTTMTVDEIDAFLHSHGNCNDTNTVKASWYPSIHYHIEDGHFVCLADERFASSGSNYGDLLKEGEESQTAAEIIYEISQTYKINPQVFLVLLEKEQGLISDSWPNSIQYRSATGFGCPDTAPCDSKYYGLKNQLESAAWLFRSVLDGGWTNYPLGENYIYYNPNYACGGSIVNIENLATSSLYRYTPYQPNSAALAAGYGTVTCGAYGNRNFYLFFMDWFGDPTVVPPSTSAEDLTTPLTWEYYKKLLIESNKFDENAIRSVQILDEQELTREETIKLLWELSGKPTIVSHPFSDLAEDDELGKKAITWAYEQGITKYYSVPEKFAPYINITRREAIIFLWRAAGEPEPGAGENIFSDMPSNPDSQKAIIWAYKSSITKYYSVPGEFAPSVIASKNEARTFLSRLH